ncbi:MAG TPA: hypothetical protein VLI67_03155, partial [Vicinamibacteria bacterium]|nr:hypothetical protein [Vicinamibacteria bacterium]
MAIGASSSRLGAILLEEGVVTPDLVDRAQARSALVGEPLADALVGLGVPVGDVLRAVAREHELPFLGRDELPSPLPVLKNLSPKYLRQYLVVPVSVEGTVLTVATADPLNPVIADDLRQNTGLAVRVVVSPPDVV